ncbi:MAG: asparagine--tRNA ligase [Mycoplasmatales bacterium]
MIIKELTQTYKEQKGKEVQIEGWVKSNRAGKAVSFLNINDGTCFNSVQVVYKDLENQEEITKINAAAVVSVKGTVKLTDGKQQSFEIEAKDVEVVSTSSESNPIQPKKHSYEFLREVSHLRPRTNTFFAVFKIRSILAQGIHEYYAKNNFVYVNTPIITANDAEGAGEMFKVTSFDLLQKNEDIAKDYFKKQANLTVSGQLHAESFALAFSKVYTFGPTFRAEKSNTTRHLAEFWMLEPEVAFTDFDGIIKESKDVLIFLVEKVLNEAKDELEFLNNLVEYDLVQRLKALVSGEFIDIDYKEAIDVLLEHASKGKKFENKVEYGIDLATEHEKFLTDEVYNSPVTIKNYPRDIKAFYMRLNEKKDTVQAFDVLVPGIGELIGGSAREERKDLLEEQIKFFNIDKEHLDWYLQLREYGTVKHAGFGIGFERLVMYVTGMENIKDVIPYPRSYHNLNY